MPKFKVTIEGKEYIVDIEPIRERPKPKFKLAKPSTIISAPQPTMTVAKSKDVVTSPMPGRVLSIKVREGDIVKKNDVLVILESMKTTVEIRSPRDGVVDKIFIKEGDAIKQGSQLVKLIPKSMPSFGLDLADRFLAGLAILKLCETPQTYDDLEKLITSKFSIKGPGMKALVGAMKFARLIEEKDGKFIRTQKGADRYKELCIRLLNRLSMIGLVVR